MQQIKIKDKYLVISEGEEKGIKQRKMELEKDTTDKSRFSYSGRRLSTKFIKKNV